jgi:hypothetical protein
MNPREREETSGKPTATADLVAAARQQRTARLEREPDDAEELREPPGHDEAENRYEAGRPRDTTRDEIREPTRPSGTDEGERLEPLFPGDMTDQYRTRWASVQSSFVDDPRRAVKQGDELIAEVMHNLAKSFADERYELEKQLEETNETSTESLRVALRRYRSFFDRLLSL